MKSASPFAIILLTAASDAKLMNTVPCPDGKQLWKITLTTDANPSQTSWTLRNGKGKLIGASQPNKYESSTTYEHTACLKPGVFKFSIRDVNGDGLCCDDGEGGYVLSVNEEVIREVSGEYVFQKDEFQFEVVESITTTADQEADAQDTQDWTGFDYAHNKFCGPKIVGGYDMAVSQCGPATKCGLESKQGQYGSSGNDCPKGLMCYADIHCGNGPGESALGSSVVDGFVAAEISASFTSGNDNAANGKPFVSGVKNAMTMTNRGSYCGSSYEKALMSCSPESHCSADDDCLSGRCFPDISCTYSGEDIQSDSDNQDGSIVSSMLEDVASSASRNEFRKPYHGVWLGLAGIGAFHI
jgi:hypothetical protein